MPTYDGCEQCIAHDTAVAAARALEVLLQQVQSAAQEVTTKAHNAAFEHVFLDHKEPERLARLAALCPHIFITGGKQCALPKDHGGAHSLKPKEV